MSDLSVSHLSVSERSVPLPQSRLWLAGRLVAAAGRLPFRLRRPVASGVYNAEIDGLRSIAIAIVVFGHFMERATRFFPVARAQLGDGALADLLLRPGLGVCLFFTISGYVITRQFARDGRVTLNARSLKSYFGRRLLRIEPPYLILLGVTWMVMTTVSYTPIHTHHFEALPRSLSLSLATSVVYAHDLVWGTYPRLFPPGWSLEVEVQFYLLAPFLMWAFFRSPRGPVRTAIGAGMLLAGCFTSLVAPMQVGPVHTDVSILRYFHFFWLGLLLADLQPRLVPMADGLPASVVGGIGWLALAAYLVMPNAPDDDLILAMIIRVATLATVAAMFVSAFAERSSFRRFCARPWISLIGGACYSIYLTHLQMIQVLTTLLAKATPQAGLGLLLIDLAVEMATVVLVGLVFYALIERTFMIRDWPGRLRILLSQALGAKVVSVPRPRPDTARPDLGI